MLNLLIGVTFVDLLITIFMRVSAKKVSLIMGLLIVCLVQTSLCRAENVSGGKRLEAKNLFDRAEALFNKSYMYGEQALSMVEKAIQLDPYKAEYYIVKADILKSMEEKDAEALAALNKADALSPHQPDVLRLKAEFLLKLKRPDEAIKVADDAFSLQSTQGMKSAVLSTKTAALISKGDIKGAVMAMDRVVALSPNSDLELMKRGKLRLVCKDYQGALGDFRRVLQVSRKDRFVMRQDAGLQIAHIYQLTNDRAKATAAYLELAQSWPDSRSTIADCVRYFWSIGDSVTAGKLESQLKTIDNDMKPLSD